VRAFHAVTGKLLWSWDSVPKDPKALFADTWKAASASRSGGANAWSVIVADVTRNLVFVPTSNPSHDYYGGERLGDNLFADAVVALRADTGARVWHFQTVHHDLWDYDVASPPILFDWRRDGRTVPAIAVASENGHVFILDRQTGRPLIPVEERPVPRSDVAGEVSSQTQPFPAAPSSLSRTTLAASEAWGATDEDRAWCRSTIAALRSDCGRSRLKSPAGKLWCHSSCDSVGDSPGESIWIATSRGSSETMRQSARRRSHFPASFTGF
jgi:quinoprotein glucose dehydrogenase